MKTLFLIFFSLSFFSSTYAKDLAYASLYELISLEEIFVLFVLLFVIILMLSKKFSKLKILNIKIKPFNFLVIAFELFVISIIFYNLVLLDRTENSLAKLHNNKFEMIKLANELRQSSDDLSHYARTYVVTGEKKYKVIYYKILDIRNGKAKRPLFYESIYWDLNEDLRRELHPLQEKISLKELISKLPFNKKELDYLKESENNSNELVHLEVLAFNKILTAHQEEAVSLLHSKDYYKAKEKIMLPIDKMIMSLYLRSEKEITTLTEQIHMEFRCILFLVFSFIIGNVTIYLILVNKFNKPIKYLIDSVRSFKIGEKHIKRRIFFNDELGELNKQFFSMRNSILKQQEEISNEKHFIDSILNSQSNIVITRNKEKIKSVNNSFLAFYNVPNIEGFFNSFGLCISDTFIEESNYLNKFVNGLLWSDYVYENKNKFHKCLIKINKENFIFSVTVDKFVFNKEEVITVTFTNITELENIKKEIESMHKNTKDSISYASLIQHSIIPKDKIFKEVFSDYFILWEPKDIVGGDIYLFEKLKNKDEYLLMVIDCTGHGVPGAFVSMLVKAIERQILSRLNYSNDEVSTAEILRYFNKTIKHLLNQNSTESLANVGFDGGIVYINKKDNYLLFSGAKSSLFYINEDKLEIFKGNKQSIGYKKSNEKFVFDEFKLPLKKGMTFYLPTDGYYDQSGGEKSFSLGKNNFMDLISKNYKKTSEEQKKEFIKRMIEHQGDEDRNDDITLISFKI